MVSFTQAAGADSDALMGVEWLGAIVVVAFERKIKFSNEKHDAMFVV
jgi:hypothetical protein